MKMEVLKLSFAFLSTILCALSAGTAYLVSIYATQLAVRFEYSSFQINAITMSGNYGNYLMGAFWGILA